MFSLNNYLFAEITAFEILAFSVLFSIIDRIPDNCFFSKYNPDSKNVVTLC